MRQIGKHLAQDLSPYWHHIRRHLASVKKGERRFARKGMELTPSRGGNYSKRRARTGEMREMMCVGASNIKKVRRRVPRLTISHVSQSTCTGT